MTCLLLAQYPCAGMRVVDADGDQGVCLEMEPSLAQRHQDPARAQQLSPVVCRFVAIVGCHAVVRSVVTSIRSGELESEMLCRGS